MASLGGVGGSDPLDAAAQRMSEIAASAEKIAASLGAASGSLGSMSGSAGLGGVPSHVGGAPSAATHTNTGNTGTAPNNGMRLGSISETYATSGPRAALKEVAVESSGILTGVFNDLRINAGQAVDYEQYRHIATRAFGGDYGAFGDAVRGSMNQYNVQDAESYYQLAAMTAVDYGGLFTGKSKEQATMSMMGGWMTAAKSAGLSQEAAYTAMQQTQSPQGYYSMMAMGVMTRDPLTNKPLSFEEISNQIVSNYNLTSYSREELDRSLAEGAPLRVSLEQSLGAEGARAVMEGLRLSVDTGGPLKEGEIDKAMEAAGAAGTEDTQARDSMSKEQQKLLENIDTYTNDVTTAVQDIADMTAGIRDIMDDLRGLLGPMMTAMGLKDSAYHYMGEGTSQVKKTLESISGLPIPGISTVAGIAASFLSEGSWNISKDQPAHVHQGEMILPARIADAVRTEMRRGSGTAKIPPAAITLDNFSSTVDAWNAGSSDSMRDQDRQRMAQPRYTEGGSRTYNVTINVQVANARDSEAVAFARRVKTVLEDERELMSIGSGRLSS